jgi:uncharacterized protein GlcG (DUF336 family)
MQYTITKKFITQELAAALIQKAIDHAKSINLSISVAIVDMVGNLVAFVRMDNANLISIGSSQGKAFTAAKSTLSTKAFADFLKANQADIASLKNENLVPIAGGLPIIYKGEIIGGIGIGGGSGEQDETCAKIALTILEN